MIESFYRSIRTMSSRDLIVNILMLLCIFILKKAEVESAASATATDADLEKEYDDVTIMCDVTGISTYRIVWQKKGKTLEGERYVQDDEKKSLTIKKAGRADVGEYVCTFIPDPVSSGGGNVSAKPVVKSIPFVDPFHGSVSPLQGSSVVLHCKVYGSPAPEVTWSKGTEKDVGTLLKSSNKTEYGEYEGVENAQLTIRDLEFDDRATYHCQASNGTYTVSQGVLVRVKDRYAALWPFIGICVEVIALIVIIFIYEKRKTKSSDDDSDSGGKANSHDQRGDVRQRNKNVRT